MRGFVVGVDGGTESLRAGIFDLRGNPVAFAAARYETRFPAPGRAEQDPREWWRALGEAVREALQSARIAPSEVIALAVDTTCCSVVLLDSKGEPVRPALIWMDVRASAEARDVAATGDRALAVNAGGAGPVSAEWMLPKALWLRRNEPRNYEAAATVCEYQDYLNLHLTGRRAASINNAAVRWHYRPDAGGWPLSLIDSLGLGDLRQKWPAEVLRLGEVVGGLTPAAAAHLGLPVNLPVAQGGADAFIAMIGLGAIRPGKMAFITGSSHLHLGITARPFHGHGIWGTYADAVLPGAHVVEGGQTSTGSVVAWLKRLLGEGVSYEALNAEAARVAPGCEGLVVQDHFQGNRTPHTDARSRGALVGLSLNHTRGHVFRAVLEGIAFGSELILETMRANGYRPDEIVIAGGATRSDLWLRIHADVSNVPLTLTRVPDAPALGSAILAAVGAGAYGSIEEAASQMVAVTRRIEPSAAAHAAYRDAYAAYKRAYAALARITHPDEVGGG
jgi:ribulokinase